jgi:hypothetical protein
MKIRHKIVNLFAKRTEKKKIAIVGEKDSYRLGKR